MFLDRLDAEIDSAYESDRNSMALLQISEPGMSPAPHEHGSRWASTSAPPTRSSPRCAAAQPAVLPDALGRPLLPSVVRYATDGDVEVGLPPRRRKQATDPRNTILLRSSA
jgi:molecular chaperone HscA